MEKIGASAKIKVIGVTGNVSSGKSTLLCALEKMGVSTLSVDTIIHNLYNTNKELINRILRLLGDNILTNHMLDRKLIAAKIFNSKELLYKLESLTCPYILEEIMKEAKGKNGPLAIEIPLLFELSLENLFDTTIFVKADKEICAKRSSLEDINTRNNRFLPDIKKEKKASITITNNGTIADFNNNIQCAIEGIIT